jgi:hypothetical protein
MKHHTSFDSRWQIPVHYSLLAILACALTSAANAAEATRPTPITMLAKQEFFCSAEYDQQLCLKHTAQLKTALLQYPGADLGAWSWFLVRSTEWRPFLLRLHLDPASPAFSALEQHSTFLEDVLFQTDPAQTAALERSFGTPYAQLLAYAVRHELGHAVCHEMDEMAANRVAGRLREGKDADCAHARGLSSLQELDLHRRSPSTRR